VLQYKDYTRTRASDTKVVSIMYALCSLPAAQHITPAVYAVILQQSTFQLDLFTAVVNMPQAQKLSSRAICHLLVAVTQRDRSQGMAEQLVRCGGVCGRWSPGPHGMGWHYSNAAHVDAYRPKG